MSDYTLSRVSNGAKRHVCFLPSLAIWSVVGISSAFAQSAPSSSATPPVGPSVPGAPSVKGTLFDRVVVIVNGDLILDSDVDQELRFEALNVYGANVGASTPSTQGGARDKAVERLINRRLVLQQIQSQPQYDAADDAVTKEIDDLRKTIPACAQYHCETKEGWDRYLASSGFTESTFREEWRERMKVLAFTEQRFRMGIRISPDRIKEYYEKTMLPQYAARHATPPPLEKISDRIQAVLLEQEVSSLLGDWLKSLRAQGSVVVMHPEGDTP